MLNADGKSAMIHAQSQTQQKSLLQHRQKSLDFLQVAFDNISRLADLKSRVDLADKLEKLLILSYHLTR